MADKENKFPENAHGPYYVDEQCIACDACIVEAPDFFEMNDEEAHAYVKKQPHSKNDLETCENARLACPVEAIGNDGEKSSS